MVSMLIDSTVVEENGSVASRRCVPSSLRRAYFVAEIPLNVVKKSPEEIAGWTTLATKSQSDEYEPVQVERGDLARTFKLIDPAETSAVHQLLKSV